MDPCSEPPNELAFGDTQPCQVFQKLYLRNNPKSAEMEAIRARLSSQASITFVKRVVSPTFFAGVTVWGNTYFLHKSFDRFDRFAKPMESVNKRIDGIDNRNDILDKRLESVETMLRETNRLLLEYLEETRLERQEMKDFHNEMRDAFREFRDGVKKNILPTPYIQNDVELIEEQTTQKDFDKKMAGRVPFSAHVLLAAVTVGANVWFIDARYKPVENSVARLIAKGTSPINKETDSDEVHPVLTGTYPFKKWLDGDVSPPVSTKANPFQNWLDGDANTLQRLEKTVWENEQGAMEDKLQIRKENEGVREENRISRQMIYEIKGRQQRLEEQVRECKEDLNLNKQENDRYGDDIRSLRAKTTELESRK
ncbi:MAG: hypothetical protein Q9169_004805 [Polycauliona sp. 2 TL-2023]